MFYINNQKLIADVEFQSMCQKCSFNVIETINYPCNHADSCLPCSLVNFSECTMCEKEVEKNEKIFLPKDETSECFNISLYFINMTKKKL